MNILLAQQCPCSGGSPRPWLLLAVVLACLLVYDRLLAYQTKKGKVMNRKIPMLIGLGVAIIIGIVFVLTRDKSLLPEEPAASFSTPAPQSVTVPGTGHPRLVDLGATECIPCKKMAPILDELKAEYAGRLDVDFIDVWQSENQSQAQVYGIQSIPTQVFLDPNGQELWRHVGFISKDDILAKWKELGINIDDPPTEAASR